MPADRPPPTTAESDDPRTLPRVTYANAAADFSGIHALLDRQIGAWAQRALGAEQPNLIGGVPDREGAPYAVASPIDARVPLGTMFAATDGALESAVTAARDARTRWRNTHWQRRVEILRGAAARIRERRFEIAIALVHEVGKSRIEALGEVEESVDLIEYYCEQAERSDGWTQPLRPGSATEHGIDLLRPYGAFAVVSPFNFPLALAVGMSSAALVAGNTVVWKPSPGAVLSAAALVDAYTAGGVPPGVFNMIAGERDLGRKLVEHPGIDGVAFTGSHEVGLAIARHAVASARPKPVLAELGGKNAAFVTPAADLDAAVSGVARAAFGLSGQKCSSCSKVYVHRSRAADFAQRLRAAADALSVGDPRLRASFTGPVINGAAGERFAEAVARARADGVLVAGGERLRDGDLAHGTYVRPTVVAGLSGDHPLNRRELFLPFVSLIEYDSLDDAIEDSNRSALGLTAGLYSRDEREIETWCDRIEAGVLYLNRASGATTGAWPGYQTFTGWKGSGTTGKGGLGPYYVAQFMREQSRTIAR